jgi:hypothetical protein
LLHDLIKWLQDVPGATDGDPATSWSAQLLGSLNLWSLLEASHVLLLIMFAGTIMLVDLRMLGLAFRNVTFSKLNDKVLPITAIGFALMILTGIILFTAKPLHYYHSILFRTKLILLLIASINIAWFHHRLQKSQHEWDAAPNPPLKVKMSAAISLTSWAMIIMLGRLSAYDWFDCPKLPAGTLAYAYAECDSAMRDIEPAPPDAELEPALGQGD